MEQFSNLIHIMMLGSKGILTLDTYGLLRTLCSPKTFEIRPARATFSCFGGPKVMLFHASMKRMTFWPWYHIIYI